MKTLVADIGGTNSRLAMASTSRTDKEITLDNVQKFRNADFNDFNQVIVKYLSILDDKLINRMCIAAAGIISKNAVEMSNLNWKITSSSLRKTSNIDKVMIINDLQAQGYALDFIKPEDLGTLIKGSHATSSNDTKLVCGMGTGFNVAIAYQSPFGTFVPASEYGHARITVANKKQKLIVKKICKVFYSKSWQTFPSAPYVNRINYLELKKVRNLHESRSRKI